RDPTVKFVKSKVARIAQDDKTGSLILHGVDTEGYHRYENRHDLVVLAIGMEPSVNGADIPAEVIADSSGFLEGSAGGGIFGAGCASGALDVNRSVQQATATALRAIQVIHKAAGAENVT
ncbi:MAG: heterodisulfide reductase subunit A, partial [Acidobacteriota bacterium]